MGEVDRIIASIRNTKEFWDDFSDWLIGHGVTTYTTLSGDRFSAGKIHRIFTAGYNNFEFEGDFSNPESFRPFINWVLSLGEVIHACTNK